MVLRILITLAALLLPAQAFANDLEGSWALRIDDANIFVFTLDLQEDGRWQGQWLRPEQITTNGVVFRRMSGAQLVRAARSGQRDGVVQLVFAGPQGSNLNDTLRFALTGENQAQVTYVGVPTDPYPLVRVRPGTLLGPFDEGRIYDRDNAALEAEYTAPEPAAEPVPSEQEAPTLEELAGSVVEEAAEVPVEVAVEAGELEEGAAEEPAATGLGADFLDGLGEADTPDTIDPAIKPETEVDVEFTRACTDLDRDNLPSPSALEDLWGTEFEAIGQGLDIREYRMDNGDIARVTMLGERVYFNSCTSPG